MKTYQHIIFWILVSGTLTLIFANWFGGYDEAFYFVSLLLPVVMGTSYFFNYYLVPRFLFTRKFRKFVIYSIYMLVVSLCLELLASIISMLVIVKFGINRAGPLVTDVYTLAGILYFIVLFKSFILLIKHYFMDQRAIGELEEKQTRLDQGYFTVRSNRQTSRIRFDELLYIEPGRLHSVSSGKWNAGDLQREDQSHGEISARWFFKDPPLLYCEQIQNLHFFTGVCDHW